MASFQVRLLRVLLYPNEFSKLAYGVLYRLQVFGQ